VLMFAACGDDDEDAGGDSTIAGLAPAATSAAAEDTTAAAAVTTVAAETTAAAAAVTTEADAVTTVAGVETSAPAVTAEAGVATTSAGVDTSGPAAVTSEAAAVETTGTAVATSAAPDATLEAAAVETSEAAAVVVVVETTAAAAATTEASVVETSEAGAATTETAAAAVETSEAAAATTEAAAESTAPATETSAAPESSAPGSVPATSAPGSSVPAGEPGAISIGSADFSESQLLAQIYGQALEAAGFDVSYELGIGAREAYYGAIEGGEVGLVPEYTGSLLGFISEEPPTAANVDEQIDALGEALPEGLEVLTPSTAEDKDTIVCTQEVVDELGLTDLSSLFENSAEITLAAPPEFETRTPFGLAGFAEIYDAEFAEFTPLPYADIPAALEGGQVDCGNIFSTNPAIDTGGFVALEDDLGIVPNEAVLPLVRSELVTPELTAALEEVNAALDTETLTALVAQVEVEDRGVDVVAAEFLASLGE
jgi:osmoprotectant transport system substrate-binding protein